MRTQKSGAVGIAVLTLGLLFGTPFEAEAACKPDDRAQLPPHDCDKEKTSGIIFEILALFRLS